MVQRKKNKKTFSVQKNDPIPFPHDGCIYHALHQDGDTAGVVQQAVALLRQQSEIIESTARSDRLVHVLKTASSIKEQLHALHAFKSWVLQQGESVGEDLYRLLLEWMLSVETPLPLRKALQSTLSILPSGIENEAAYKSLLESITASTPCWKDPVSAITEALSWMSVTPDMQVETLRVLLVDSQRYAQKLEEETTTARLDQSYMNLVQDCLLLVTVVKTIMENLSLQNNNNDLARPVAKQWLPFLYQLLRCRAVLPENLPIVSIGYARATVMQQDGTVQDILARTDVKALADVPRVVLIQGLVAAVFWEDLEPQLVSLTEFLESMALQSSDLQVRIMALKTLRTVVSRCASHDCNVPSDLMETVLESWEDPPCRKLAQAVAALFQSLVKVHPREELPALVDRIMKQPPHRKGKYIALETLLPIVGATASPTLLHELLVGITNQGHNRGAIANLWQTLLTQETDWVPSLADALVTTQPFSSRQQIAAFCLPRIQAIPEALEKLLKELSKFAESDNTIRDADRLTARDRLLWAQLDVVRMCAKPDEAFRLQVASSLPLCRVKSAITHISPQMRLAALNCLHQVLSCHNELPDVVMQEEMHIMKYMLPYVVKTPGKEYVSSLLECTIVFIDRLIVSEQPSGRFPLTHAFVVDFLLGDMIHFLGYPGTVQDKETFLLSMLESLLLFAARDILSLGLDKRLVAKRGAVWARSHSDAEKLCLSEIRKALVRAEVFAALFSILHSRWDGSRAHAYEVLKSFLRLVHSDADLALPVDLCDEAARVSFFDRALHLASSPRQREADSGARMLSIFCQSMPGSAEKYQFVADMTTLLDGRLDDMKAELDAIVAQLQTDAIGSRLPLSHGIIHALHLIIENERSLCDNWDDDRVQLLERLATILSKGIRISLAVVADVKDGESLEGLDGNLLLCGGDELSSDRSGVRVNPGALGANGIFSSITRVSREEHQRRLVSQRIVMGSWLLTREACDAIAVVLGAMGHNASASLLDNCATLLINTLTSLKHVGAAFAAHSAVEAITQLCFRSCHDSLIEQLPKSWAQRLLRETELDRVRNSTLRRSTGYALGFLSIMRAGISSGPHLHALCRDILSSILQLSLPSRDKMQGFTRTLGLNGPGEMFSFLDTEQWQGQPNHELRTRIHALNVLRMIILDAPLAKEIYPIIGDAIVSSVIGYTDHDWAVRNSSTMIFAAIMLRAIDADKNAHSDTAGRNATSLTELVRAYPMLLKFLLAVLKASISGVLKSDKSMSLPPVLPILLLFARVQPVCQCGPDAVSLVEPFLPYVLQALEHPEMAIRKAAARTLANISSFESKSPTNVTEILTGFEAVISGCVGTFGTKKDFNWNKLHGALEATCALMKKSAKEMDIARTIFASNSLFDTCWIIDQRPVIPPTCLLVAINLLSGLLPSSDCTLERCDEVKRWLELPTSSYFAGAGELGLRVGHVTASYLAARIWNAKSWNDVEALLPNLKSALMSRSIDFRLSAVKAFKRKIYTGLDKTIESSQHATQLIHSLTLILANSLSHESYDPIKCHPPTMRRISRCLLECLDSASRLGILEGLLSLIRSDAKIFFRAVLMNDVGNDAETQTFGNAIELYAFFVAYQSGLPQLFDFQRLVKLACDPRNFWRVRYSAAVAMDRSNYLRTSGLDSRQLNDISMWLDLIQDFDEDVRLAAAKLAHEAEIPEISLSRLIQKPSFLINNDARISFVLQLSESLSRDVLGIIKNMNAEDSDRKIFEEEDHNSYLERFIPFHLAVGTCDGVKFSLPDKFKAVSETLMQRCKKVLSCWIGLSKTSHSIIFSVSRQPNIFLPLHALLIGCLLVIESTEDVDFPSEFRNHAAELSRKESTHPSIRGRFHFIKHLHPLSEAERILIYSNGVEDEIDEAADYRLQFSTSY